MSIKINSGNLEEPNKNSFVNQSDNEALFRIMVNSVSEYALIMTDPNGLIISWNKGATVLLGYEESEILGKPISTFYTQEAIENGESQKNLNYAFTNTNHRTEGLRVKKDGTTFWADVQYTALYDDKILLLGYAKIIRDISDKKEKDELHMRTIEELYAYKYALDESAIVAITDQKGIINHVNENFCKISKYTKEELTGQDHRIINSAYHDKAFIRNLWITIASGNVWKGEMKNKAKDGSFYWVDTTIVPFLNNKGKPYQYIAIRSDITERKLAEIEITKQKKQIEELLESITDGFIEIDENMCYTYANKQIGNILGLPAESLIGKNVWDLFPDAVGSLTYYAIHRAFAEKQYIINEDYYAPLDLWQENRIYPSVHGVSVFISDISKRKQEEHRLKLLESVITNTTDAVLITEALPFEEPGPKILYVNEAFTKMTGYSSDDVVGKTPRILQGPKSDRLELQRLGESLRKWQPCEITTINYKKNREEFWINFSVSPVANEKGLFTHWISIDKDVTQRKNDELQKVMVTKISVIFNEHEDLNEALNKTLELLAEYGDFNIAEAWLVGTDKKKLNLVKFLDTAAARILTYENPNLKSFVKGEGLAGVTWASNTIQFWNDIDEQKSFIRKKVATKTGLKAAYGLPLSYNNEVIGVIVLGSASNYKQESLFIELFESSCKHLGAEIRRKQLEQELNQIFTFAPDTICIAGTDGYLKKVNPAMCRLTGFTEDELLSMPLIELFHPDDHEKILKEMRSLSSSKLTLYFENRCITKSGEIKWLDWTSTPASEKGLLFSIAKDITDKKDLEVLLSKAIQLARIGAWEIDLATETVQWSEMTKEIHEVEEDFKPDFTTALAFFKEGKDRDSIMEIFEESIQTGKTFDLELKIVTAKGKTKWIRVIGETEFINGTRTKIAGSFQDIHDRKMAESMANEALEERNTILESIDDAFFAIDRNWTVTYWNSTAEKILGKQKHEIIDHKLWEVFSTSLDSNSFIKYNQALETNTVVHFEDYYPPLDKWYEISAYPSDNGLSVYFQDVTERANYIKEIEEKNIILQDIAWIQSHVVRAPVSKIMGLIDLINDLKDDPKNNKQINEMLNYVLISANELDVIIKEILTKPPLLDYRTLSLQLAYRV